MLTYRLPLSIEQLEDILTQIRDEFITLHYEVSRLKSKLGMKDGEWNDDNWVDNDLME